MPKSLAERIEAKRRMLAGLRQNRDRDADELLADAIAAVQEDDQQAEQRENLAVQPANVREWLGAYFVNAGDALLPNPGPGLDDEDELQSGDGLPARTYQVSGVRREDGSLSSVTLNLRYDAEQPAASRSAGMTAIMETRAAGRNEEADRAMDRLLGSTAWRDVIGPER
jgi:hypothetical protein